MLQQCTIALSMVLFDLLTPKFGWVDSRILLKKNKKNINKVNMFTYLLDENGTCIAYYIEMKWRCRRLIMESCLAIMQM